MGVCRSADCNIKNPETGLLKLEIQKFVLQSKKDTTDWFDTWIIFVFSTIIIVNLKFTGLSLEMWLNCIFVCFWLLEYNYGYDYPDIVCTLRNQNYILIARGGFKL